MADYTVYLESGDGDVHVHVDLNDAELAGLVRVAEAVNTGADAHTYRPTMGIYRGRVAPSMYGDDDDAKAARIL